MGKRKPLAYVFCPFCNWFDNAANGGVARETLRWHIVEECQRVLEEERMVGRSRFLKSARKAEAEVCANTVRQFKWELQQLMRTEDERHATGVKERDEVRRKEQRGMCAAHDTAERAVRERAK